MVEKKRKEVCVFLTEGCEEVEALTAVDLLRRAGVTVFIVSITGQRMVCGSHGIKIQTDRLFEEVNYTTIDMLVLPGGMPGTTHLGSHKGLQELLLSFHEQRRYLAAICAAPSILGELGILEKKTVTAYPSVIAKLQGAEVVSKPTVICQHIITGRSMGTAIDFSLNLIQVLMGQEKAQEICESILYKTKEM
ncbi:MAG: DJ-1/PfpI family protein [Lachnospiraceae bacterium]